MCRSHHIVSYGHFVFQVMKKISLTQQLSSLFQAVLDTEKEKKYFNVLEK